MHKSNGISILSIVPIRKKPSHTSELVSHLLFGETYEATELPKDPEWVKIVTHHDQYPGYIAKNQHCETEIDPTSNDFRITKESGKIDLGNGSIWIPEGSRLWNFNNGTFSIGSNSITFKGNILSSNSPKASSELIRTSKAFLNTPYLWGGRSVLGMDCSGFVQLVFLLNGLALPRDASQQFQIGKAIDFGNLQNGDLAFFSNNKGKITHVGMVYDDNGKIIHASGKVRIDKLNHDGIYTIEENEKTHHLAGIKRIVQ